MEKEGKKRVLGKGLNALISSGYSVESSGEGIAVLNKTETSIAEKFSPPAAEGTQNIRMIPVSAILPNPEQPRIQFSDETLQELADSMKEQGVLQPVIVTQKGNGYQLICGERRVRAANLAGMEKIPAVIKEVSPDKILEAALVENIQREDLNPIEEALAYGKLIEEQKLSQDDVAKRVGKNRSTVANSLRLLRLPREVQDLVGGDAISAGHARALVSLFSPEHQRAVAQKIARENLSVRQTEELVQNILAGKRPAKRTRRLDPHIEALERKLENRIGTRVRVFNNKKNQGRIEIKYFSLDELDRILEILQIGRE
ncbi:MAG TPA: ParB/RepB/Spo0J family partition protein [Candidatus Omnitrophota bacterium]|nr:ParB/RepB/Spo0J family partition protein [Candidatus Omnitrophota bacterium]